MRLDRLLAFRLLASLLIVGALAHVATVWPRVAALAAVLDRLPGGAWVAVAGFAVSAATALVACALAALLVWKAADRADARALTLFLCFLAIFWGSLFRFLEVTVGEGTVSASLSYGDGWVSRTASFGFVLAVAAFVRFSALFPRPLAADRLPPARRFPALRRLRAAFLSAPVVWGVTAVALILLELAPPVLARLAGVPDTGAGAPAFVPAMIGLALFTYVALPLAAFALGTRNLRASYRSASADERRRILWVVAGFAVSAWLILGALGLLFAIAALDVQLEALGVVVPVAIFIAPLVLVTCAAIGILRSGAVDPALVLRRSTVYGALGVLAVIAFASLENALSALVEARLGLPGVIGSMIAGALVAAVLIPVRAPLQRMVARRAHHRSGAATVD
jgi:hypothetical protein